MLRPICVADRELAAVTPNKSPAFFQGRSLVEQCNCYIPFLIAFPPPGQNISTALFRLHTTSLMRHGGTGKTPGEGRYRQATGLNIESNGPCVYSMRATATTNVLSHDADIAKVQELARACHRLHAPPLCRLELKPEDSPAFRVRLKHPSQCLRSRGGMGSFPGGTVSESRQCPSRP